MDCIPGCFGSQHTALHGVVGALDFGKVYEASGATYQGPTWEVQFWHRLQPSFIQHASTV